MKKTLKNIQKCVRMSEFTAVVVEDTHGDSFNQKFENLVYMFAQEERDLKKSIASLRAEEKRLVDRIDKLNRMERTLRDIKYYLDTAKKYADNSPIDGQLEL